MIGALARLIVIPCGVALLTWFVMRSLQDWWWFGAFNDRRPGVVFVAAMIALAAVVISEFLSYQRRESARALANRLSLHFASEVDSSLAMEIKHLVVGKGSSCHLLIKNVIRGRYQGMQLLMADLKVGISSGDDTLWETKTIWFFTDRVSFYPNFRILPRTNSLAAAKPKAGDLSHFPPFARQYTIASDEQEVAEQVVTSEFRDYFKSRHCWQVHANGTRIAFVRDGKISVDEWERFLREAIGAVKLLHNTVQELLDGQKPLEGEGGRAIETQGLAGKGSRMWGAGTETFEKVDDRTKATVARGTRSRNGVNGSGNAGSRETEDLKFEKKDSANTLAVVESLIDSASQKAVRYHEVIEFMQGLPPRTVPSRLQNENVPRVPFVFWCMSLPVVVFGLMVGMIGVLGVAGFVKFGDAILIVFGLGVILPVFPLWVFFYRRRLASLQILREGVCASATVRSIHSTEDYDVADWLVCLHRIDVSFLAGNEMINSKVTVKGMQMKTLQRCLNDELPVLVLYLKNRPKRFLLAVQISSKRFAE